MALVDGVLGELACVLAIVLSLEQDLVSLARGVRFA